MLRWLIVATAALSVAGCATEAKQAEIVTRVKTVVKRERCTTVRELENICGKPRACTDVGMTCAEAYHRLTICNEWQRDGGVAGGTKGADGIPCESLCGKTALEMAAAIRAAPFTPPMRETSICERP